METPIKVDLDFNRNEDTNKLEVAKMRRLLKDISLGGGQMRIDKQHKKGKLTARERIDFLIDKNSYFLELGAFAGYEMYEEYGGCPAGGVVGGIGYVSGRQCLIVANDATVKAGAWFPITAKKKSAFSGNCHGEPATNYLLSRFCRCFSSHAR